MLSDESDHLSIRGRELLIAHGHFAQERLINVTFVLQGLVLVVILVLIVILVLGIGRERRRRRVDGQKIGIIRIGPAMTTPTILQLHLTPRIGRRRRSRGHARGRG